MIWKRMTSAEAKKIVSEIGESAQNIKTDYSDVKFKDNDIAIKHNIVFAGTDNFTFFTA